MNNRIFWTTLAHSTYVYGAEIGVKEGRVFYENPLLPVGAIVKEWRSQYNYQGSRVIPELPILKRGQTYTVSLVADIIPQNSIYIQIECYDRYNHRVDLIVMKDVREKFVFPLDAYTYSIQLLNAGCHQLLFDYIEITEVTEQEVKEEIEYDCLLFEAPHSEVSIIFLESKISLPPEVEKILANKGNCILLPDSEQCLSDDFQEKMWKIIRWAQEEKRASTIQLIAYGPMGNLAVLYFSKLFPQTQAYTTTIWHSPKKYISRLQGRSIFAIRKIVTELLSSQISDTISTYGVKGEDSELDFVQILLAKPEQLLNLPQLQKE